MWRLIIIPACVSCVCFYSCTGRTTNKGLITAVFSLCHLGIHCIRRRKRLKHVSRYVTANNIKIGCVLEAADRFCFVLQKRVQNYSSIAQKINANFLCDEGG
jgi:hypothetical protein